MATRLDFPPSTGTYRTLVVPVLEPGQAFRDPDLTNLTAALRSGLFKDVTAYFRENSFDALDLQFQVFGQDVAPRAQPLRLPRAIREYWNPGFEAGGFDAVVAGLGAAPTIALDGTEALRLAVGPRLRPATAIDVTFSALSAERSYGVFPVSIPFAASDELRLRVTDRLGTARDLVIGFPATSFSVNASSVDADLAAIASFLDARIQAATAALNLPGTAPALLQPVRLRRVREAGGGLGRLVLDLSVHADYGDGSARIEVVSVTGLAGFGFGTAAARRTSFSLPGDRAALETYLARRLQLAQEPGGFSGGNRLLADPTVTFAAGTLTVRFRLSDFDGGTGSSLGVVSQAGLAKLGLAAATLVAGVVTAGTSFVARDSLGLLGDVLGVLNDALGAGDQTGWLKGAGRDFRCIYVVFLGAAPPGTWDADAAQLTDERMFKTWTTSTHPTQPSTQVLGNWITSVFPGSFALGTACHELSHTLGGVQGTQVGSGTIPSDWCLGLPDTYDNDPDNQNDLRYLGNWDLMSNHRVLSHLAGYHKRHLRWIPAPARILSVPLPNPMAPTVEECWLVPIEHWSPTMEADVRDAVGGTVPIRQLMEIVLPGDGGRFLLVEARAAGTLFSQNLPFSPALLVTDGIACSDPERYVVDFKYRRYVHPLNTGSELRSAGDTFDLATAPELAYEGTVVSVVDRQDVGGIPVLQTRVRRAEADYIDLQFTDANPPWRTPDLWVDWPGNGTETYPVGSPYGQGDTVRFPLSGTEPHRLVARVHNHGTVQALDVDVRFYIWEPAGSGDKGEFRFVDNHVIPSVGAGAFELADGSWNVGPANNKHQCALAQISDWTIPRAPGGGPVPVFEATTDLWLNNNRAQKNIADFQAKTGSPYDPYPMALAIANDGPEDLLVYLEPFGLPPGVRLTCIPRTLRVPAKASAQFSITVLVDTGVPPGAASDATFVLHACRWTRDMETTEAFGGWQITIRPRQRSTVTITATSQPPNVVVTGTLSGGTPNDRVWIRLTPGRDQPILWQAAPVLAGGGFTTTIGPVAIGVTTAQIEAHFDGSDVLAAATAGPLAVPTGTGGPIGGGPGGTGGIGIGVGTPIGGGGGGVVVGGSTGPTIGGVAR